MEDVAILEDVAFSCGGQSYPWSQWPVTAPFRPVRRDAQKAGVPLAAMDKRRAKGRQQAEAGAEAAAKEAAAKEAAEQAGMEVEAATWEVDATGQECPKRAEALEVKPARFQAEQEQKAR